MNITISVPDGTTNHGNPQLLCVPSAWTDILTFLVTNYYAHAATVLLDPGVASRRTIVLIIAALILPLSSISRAVRAICRHAVTERKNPLKRAARSRALCKWEVAEGYEPIPKHSTIYGEYWLNEDYYLAFVPHYADLAFARPTKESSADGPGTTRQKVTIPNSYSVIQAFIGIVQALWAIITIYQARGDQIQQYGYAAFGLTVVPYAFMSVVQRLCESTQRRQYATIFVVRTPAMTEAEQRGKAFFKAAFDVDLLRLPASAVPSKWTPVMQMYLPLLLSLVPLAVVGGLSNFQAGNNITPLQRGFTMTWLVVGIVYGSVLHFGNPNPDDDPLEEEKKKKKKKTKEKSEQEGRKTPFHYTISD